MDKVVRRLRRKARAVGLDVRGPYADDTYSLEEGSTFLGQGTAEQVEAEIAKHAGVPRLADAHRKRNARL